MGLLAWFWLGLFCFVYIVSVKKLKDSDLSVVTHCMTDLEFTTRKWGILLCSVSFPCGLFMSLLSQCMYVSSCPSTSTQRGELIGRIGTLSTWMYVTLCMYVCSGGYLHGSAYDSGSSTF